MVTMSKVSPIDVSIGLKILQWFCVQSGITSFVLEREELAQGFMPALSDLMQTNVPLSLYRDDFALENAEHLWQTSGEDASINYYLDTNGLEDDYAVEMPMGAIEATHEALEQIEDLVGIEFNESSWHNADWVIGVTNDYDNAYTSMEDWGLWSSWYKDPDYAAKWTFTESDEAFLLNEIGFSLGLGLLPESSQNKYSLTDSAMSAGWKGDLDGFTESDINAFRHVWSPFLGVQQVADQHLSTPGNIQQPSRSNTQGAAVDSSNANISSGPGSVITVVYGDGNQVEVTVDNSLRTVNVNMNDLLIGTSAKGERVKGTFEDDLLSNGEGRDTLIGGDGADQFYFDNVEPYGKKTVDKVVDFDAREGDRLVIGEALLDADSNYDLAIAESKRDLKQLSREDFDLVYFEPKGDLYLDGNDGGKGFGGKQSGGLLVDLPNETALSSEDVLIGL